MNDLLLLIGTILTGTFLAIAGITWNYDIREPESLIPYLFAYLTIISFILYLAGWFL